MIKRVLKKFSLVYDLLFDKYYSISYSQEGEDLILKRYFSEKAGGFYVDVGAHHPKRFSNTYMFYKKGWSGINIDAMPGSMKLFNKVRNKDINLEIAISNENKELTFFMFNEPALNGFSERISKERSADYKLLNRISITTKKLSEILDKNLPKTVKKIDFMSIDVEGLDLEVLKSNDWEKFRPSIVLVELLNLNGINEDPITLYLKEVGYKFYAKSHFTNFFVDNRRQENQVKN